MVGCVGRGVLLDSDLGDMLDLVVNLVSNMLDSRCSIGIGSSRHSNWSSFHFNSLDLSNGWGSSNNWGSNMVGSRGSNMVSSWGSIGISGSRNNSWSSFHFHSFDLSNCWGSSNNWGGNMVGRGSILDNWDNLANGVNKSIFIDILRESLKSKRSIATLGSNQITNSGSQRSRSCTRVDVSLGKQHLGISFSFSNWSSKATATKSRQNSKVFHID